ncbi:MAG: hypothetical protein CMG66_04080 [Candidatus Marinimicrobia bacterium]|nr:hypothetical protein [Candidatus Neomarinimicrobiota bacterium]|tara:strand:+ start:1066 stop:1251 length:186 start_codon:yes stop_codon:yes gene_type:complete
MKKKYINSFIIGFMTGIAVYGVTNNATVLWALLPLISIYLLANKDSIKKDFKKGYEDAYKD